MIVGIEWLAEIREHYGTADVTPFVVAAEILLGATDPAEAALAINRRGRRVGDDVMATTTAADVADAIEELISLGFLESVFAAPTSAPGAPADCEEHVLRAAIARIGELTAALSALYPEDLSGKPPLRAGVLSLGVQTLDSPSDLQTLD